jgi:hypothetical protein
MEMDRLLTFLSKAQTDPRLSTAHISIYVVLFAESYIGHADPVSFSRPAVMQSAKISSRATYHRCMRDLNDFGYIRYIPSHHPALGSLAFLAGKSPA